MSATPLQVYEAIKPKLGEKESQLLLEHIARQTEIAAGSLATKGDLDKLAGTVERLAATVEKLAAGMEKFATKADIEKFATKADIRDMATKTELATVRAEIASVREQMATKADLAREIGALRAEMHDEIGKLRSEVIKWMFIFWIGQVATITGILFAFFKP